MAEILLSKKNLFHNLKLISKHTGSKDKVAVVLKDNAYGHGLKQIATLAQEFGIKKAVVRSEEEAHLIKDNFEYILILANEEIKSYSPSFHITLNSLDNISLLPKNSKVHIKIDTGMHRNGIHPNELNEAFHGLLKKDIQITGVFTHHRSADTLSSEFFWQNEIFKQVKSSVLSLCEQLSLSIPSFHSCNSSALFRHTNFNEDFARVGIATYGYLETNKIYNNPNLKPVLSLWANKIASRKLKAGQKVGYGGGFTAKEDIIISTYDIGYGDGFLRINENQDFKCADNFKLLGRVSMDNSSFLTNKDKICIFNDAKPLAKLHNTISYEIVTTLNKDIKKSII